MPDPANYESDGEWDRYDYWQDIEHDNDGYEDYDQLIAGEYAHAKKPAKATNTKLTPAPKKRKTLVQALPNRSKKRRKTDDRGIKLVPPVQLLTVTELRPLSRKDDYVRDISELRPVTMLGWKDYLRGAGAQLMEKVAEQSAAEHLISPLVEGDAEDDLEGEEDEEMDGPPNIEAIQMALHGNLQSLGLDLSSVDQGSLLQLVQSMMSKDSNAEELLGKFIETFADNEEDDDNDEVQAEAPVNGADKQNGNVFAEWVSGQARESAKQKEPPVQVPGGKMLELGGTLEEETEGQAPQRSKRKQEAADVAFSPRKKRNTRRDDESVKA